MRIFKPIAFFVAGLIISSCSSIPKKEPFQVVEWLRTTEPNIIEFISRKLLLFETDDPLRWQEAKNGLKQVPLWPQIIYLLKEVESTEPRRALTARWKLACYGKMIKHLKCFDGDSLAEWNAARQELAQLGSEAIENMVEMLSHKFMARELKYRQWAAEELKTIGPAGIQPVLVVIKKTEHQEIIESLAFVLTSLGPEAETPLRDAIMGNNLNLSLTLIKALAVTRPYYSTELLEYISRNHKHPEVKTKAMEVLATLRKE